MTRWLSSLIIGSCLGLAAILYLVSLIRRWRVKSLRAEIKELKDNNEALAADLSTMNTSRGEAENRAAQAERDAKEASLRENEQRGQKEGLSTLYHELADFAWLHSMADTQALNIQLHAKITEIKPCGLALTDSPRFVGVEISIRNDSVFDMTIHAEHIKGHLFFNTTQLTEPARGLIDADHHEVKNLKPKQTGKILIQQPLLRFEAETISEADGNSRFWIGNLSIPISIENVPQKVKSKCVRPGKDEHIYLMEFGALILDEHEMTPRELIEDINALPPRERVQVYKAALSAYETAVAQIHYRESEIDPEDKIRSPVNRNTNNA